MSPKQLLATLGMALMAASIGTSASAEIGNARLSTITGSAEQNRNDQDRSGRDRNGRDDRRRQQAPSPEQILNQAQAAATAAGLSCQATQAAALGVANETGAAIFEVACASGPGYIIVNSTPAESYDCVALSGAAEQARLRDPNAEVGQQCTLPTNQDTLRVLRAYATDAGISCQVDQASAIGVGSYEIGCVNTDGYWISRQTDGSWERTPCWDLANENRICRYSTEDERRMAWRPILASTTAADCDVQRYRRIGRDAQGLILYELQCGVGEGWFVRLNSSYQAARVQTCQESTHVGGGCILTATSAAGGRP